MAARVGASSEQSFDAREFHDQCRAWNLYWQSDSNIKYHVTTSIARVMAPVPLRLQKWRSSLLDEEGENHKGWQQTGQSLTEEGVCDDAHPNQEVETASSPSSGVELRAMLKRYLQDNYLQAWLQDTPLPNKSAGRAFLVHQFFALIESTSGKAGVIIEFIAEQAHRTFSRKIAATIECTDKDLLREELWPSFAGWLFQSLAQAEKVSVGWGMVKGTTDDPNELNENPDEAGSADTQEYEGNGLWWDPDAAALGSLIRREGLRQFRGDRVFLPNAFIYSPVGRLLQDNMAKVEYLIVQKTDTCQHCGTAHTFVETLYEGCHHCQSSNRTRWRRRWLIWKERLEAVEFGSVLKKICANEKCYYVVEDEDRCPQCQSTTKTMPVFQLNEKSISRDASWMDAEGKQIPLDDILHSADEEAKAPDQQLQLVEAFRVISEFVHPLLRQTLKDTKEKGKPADLYRFSVLVVLTGGQLLDVIDDPLRLPDGWQVQFYNHLAENGDIDVPKSLRQINENLQSVSMKLGISVPKALNEANFKVIKSRCKKEWDKFLIRRATSSGER
jgi:hypothetical protein